jgi:hypothetical protein
MLTRNRWLNTFGLFMLAVLLTRAGFAQSRAGDYIEQDSARFRVAYCPEDAGTVRELWQTLRLRVPYVEQRLGLALADTVMFVVTPSAKEWQRLTGGAPLWANGLAFAEKGVAVLKSPRFSHTFGPLSVAAVHEYVHVLLRAGAPNVEIPRWLDEGLAQVLAGQIEFMDDAVLARAAAANRLHTFEQLEMLMSMSVLDAHQGYAESAVAVELLEKRYGAAGLSNLMHELRRGQDFTSAFTTIFSRTPSQFEHEYFSYLQSHYRISLIGDMELWVSLAFVLLLGAGGVAVWLRRKRVLAKWRREEGQQSETGETPPPPFTVNYTIVRGRLQEGEDESPPDANVPHDEPRAGN